MCVYLKIAFRIYSKSPGVTPDPLHTYMSLSGFALAAAAASGGCVASEWIKELCPTLGMSVDAAGDFVV